jgi:hypothetical protein
MADFIRDVRAILELFALMAIMAATVGLVMVLWEYIGWPMVGLMILAPPLWGRCIPYVMPTWDRD